MQTIDFSIKPSSILHFRSRDEIKPLVQLGMHKECCTVALMTFLEALFSS